MASPTLPVWDLVKESFASVLGRLPEFLRRYVFIFALIFAGFLLVAFISADLKPSFAGAPPVYEAQHPFMDILMGIAAILLISVAIIRFYVMFLRAQLLGEGKNQLAALNFARREWAMSWTMVKKIGLLMGCLCIMGIVAGILTVIPILGIPLGVLASLAGAAALIWLQIRLVLCYPISALDQPKPLAESYRLTKGYVWPILGSGFLLGLGSVALSMAAGLIGGLLAAVLDLVWPFLGVIVTALVQALMTLIGAALLLYYEASVYGRLKAAA